MSTPDSGSPKPCSSRRNIQSPASAPSATSAPKLVVSKAACAKENGVDGYSSCVQSWHVGRSPLPEPSVDLPRRRCNGYIAKPIDPATFGATVRNFPGVARLSSASSDPPNRDS